MTDGIWKRRERSMAAGVVLWALAVSSAAALRPEAVAEWLLSTPGPEIAGVIMISIGLTGAFCDTIHVAGRRYVSPPETNGLTEVPWDE